MSQTLPTLHMLCGKIASGKSTLADHLTREDKAVRIAEDQWLNTLFLGEIETGADYLRCTGRLRETVAPHVIDLLNAGVSVVLDFAANTIQQRVWMRGILDRTSADHQLHVLDVPEEVCLARLRARNASGEHPFSATEEQFHQFSKHFVLPTPQEGLIIVFHTTPEKAQPTK
ncbi:MULTISPECIES: AAA family ATPase [Rhodobacterales]|jgi:predicted kinase|uniref:AAA family ATPase n=1 Tax=Rhodobacterales TaxID=204455 RepID=UPI00237F0809|nr:ATP-binding protein [Phaeobacter gallaeciensis]MDE4097886.1 ATP-binding protein [Phaeobacter gallaeciensis]MDE4106855.1 ATP-binding protein [Phaeobacter gallaeciensis]MDE4111309.1 ATP-binding protein [Phaeobacter gallaeciensis]MDE4115621.1 ATP-binding protein [Phaeobacter gallaeciensis]MDE4120250.1 ATP-binding protein [Phaeobacter gallaeciensis]